MSFIQFLQYIYIILSIILLVSFFGGLIYSINSDPVFVEKMSCNKTSSNINEVGLRNGFIVNVTEENNDRCDKMEELVNKSNNLIFFVVLFWALLLKDDFIELFKWLESKIEIK